MENIKQALGVICFFAGIVGTVICIFWSLQYFTNTTRKQCEKYSDGLGIETKFIGGVGCFKQNKLGDWSRVYTD